MPIIINEFEVEPGEAKPASAAASTENQKANYLPSPWEIEQLVEQQFERRERVWAH